MAVSAVRIFSVSALLYLAVGLTLIMAAGGLPYVIDNNETFSNFIQAKNIYDHGLRAYGLTDETLSPKAEAGPFVYTHLGNLPRFYALLLYAISLDTPEAQILGTFLTVGLAAFLLAVGVALRLGDKVFACCFIGLFLTDYLMIQQWQVVTPQVWRFLLFFGLSWLLLDWQRPKPAALWAVGAIAFASAYFDISFAVFLLAFGVALTLGVVRNGRMHLILSLAAGAAAGGGLLILQNLAYLGGDGFLTDLRYTFYARNVGAATAQEIESILEFYANRSVVFWLNFAQGVSRGDALSLLQRFGFEPYSPSLSFAALSAGLLAITGGVGTAYRSVWRRYDNTVLAPIVILPTAYGLLASSILIGNNVVDFAPAGTVFQNWCGYAISAAVISALIYDLAKLAQLAADKRMPSLPAMYAVSAMAVLLAVWARLWSIGNANSGMSELWETLPAAWGGAILTKTLIAVFAWLAMRSLFCEGLKNDAESHGRRLGWFCLSTAIGYFMVALFLPGYAKTTILARYLPLTIFFSLPVFAAALALCLRGIWGMIGGPQALAIGGMHAACTVFFLASWLTLQGIYVWRIPPDSFAFLKTLRAPPYAGHSFVTNVYAAPVAAMTGQWAYFDLAFGAGEVVKKNGDNEIKRNSQFLWFVDRASNPDYARPDYYLCIRAPSIYQAVPGRSEATCGKEGLVARARRGESDFITYREVERSPPPSDHWSIIQMFW